MVMTDALEMRAISATIGVEKGAVRALAAGADALCLGHDLGDESVESVARAIATAVGSGRLPEERLVAASRALTSEGAAALVRPALIVELASEPSIAAGQTPGPGERLLRALPGARLERLAQGARFERPARSNSGQLVIVTRDA